GRASSASTRNASPSSIVRSASPSPIRVHGSRVTMEDAMPTAIFHTTVSLDGFTAGTGGAMDWMFVDGEPGPAADEVIDRVGAILAGRRSWDPNPTLAADERTAKPYGGRWSGPIVVLTHRPEEAPDDPDVTFVSGGVEAALDV